MRGKSGVLTIVAGIVGLSLFALVFAHARITTAIDAQLSENWRGQYDILVLSHGSEVSGSETAGLVEPNFIASAGDSGITLEQLEKIRQIPGVEVAAPVGMVGVLNNTASGIGVQIYHTPENPLQLLLDGPVLFRLGLTAEYSDTRNDESALLAADQSGFAALSQITDSELDIAAMGWGSSNSFGPTGTNLGAALNFPALPFFAHTVYAIDPQAEAALFNSETLPHAQSLIGVPEQRTTADFSLHPQISEDDLWAGWIDRIDEDQFPLPSMRLDMAQAFSEKPDAGLNGVILPLTVRTDTFTQLRVTAKVETAFITEAEFSSYALSQELLERSDFVATGQLEIDMSGLLVPFNPPESSFSWFGQNTEESFGQGYNILESEDALRPALIGRPDYLPVDTGYGEFPSFELVPQGIRHIDGTASFEWPTEDFETRSHGQVQTYKKLEYLSSSASGLVYLAPVGTFQSADLIDRDADRVAYVPSGIAPSDTAVRADGGVVTANPSQLDFLTATAGAFTDLQGGQLLRGETPIDVIRVRVADVADYSPVNQQKILDIAQQILGLGLEARVVAGSSLAEVALYVPDYYVADDGTTSDLGWVTQEWTNLGAAVQVEGASVELLLLLSWAVFALVLAGFVVVLLLSFQGQRRALTVLSNVGWTSQEQYRYLVRSALPALGIIVLTTVAVLAFPEMTTPQFPLVAVAVAAVAVFLGAGLALRGADNQVSHRSGVASTLTSLAMRQVAAQKGVVALSVLGVSSIGIVIFLTVRAYERLREIAGATRLAEYMFSSNGIAFIVLTASGVVIGSLLLLIARRAELQNRAKQAEILSNLGLESHHLRRQFFVEDLVVSGLTTVATAAVIAVMVMLWGYTPMGVLLAGGAMVFAVLARSAAGWFTVTGITERKDRV